MNVSIDTLDADKFKRMTKRGDLDKVLEGIFAAKAAGLAPIKLNAVIERGVNDDDILPLVEFSRANGFAMRFIEYMDVGNSNNWTSAKLVAKKEIIANDPCPLSAAGNRPRSGQRAVGGLRICRRPGRYRRDRFGDRTVLFELHAVANYRRRETRHLPIFRCRS